MCTSEHGINALLVAFTKEFPSQTIWRGKASERPVTWADQSWGDGAGPAARRGGLAVKVRDGEDGSCSPPALRPVRTPLDFSVRFFFLILFGVRGWGFGS